jgi:DNA-binding transcriptional LysR family regulator
MDKFTAIKVFLETVERGSVSAASDHLDMSRAMASRYVAYMEAWAGARLLHRTTRKLTLTTAGTQMLPLCREMLKLAENMEATVAEQEGEPRGQLRITTSAVFAHPHMTDAAMAYLARYPATSIDLQIVDRTVNLIEERIDLAIRITNNLDPNLIARKIATCRSVLCASPAYLKANGMPVTPHDLSQHNCLTYTYFGKSLWQFEHSGLPVSVTVQGNFSANEALVLQQAAISGCGITTLPAFAVNDLIKQGQLVSILPDYKMADMGIYAVYASRKQMPQIMRTMIDFLVDRFSEKSDWA